MKKIIALVLLAAVALDANAWTFWNNGVLYGTVCRNGYYWTNYYATFAQPVGTYCPVRDAYGNIIGTGVVTNE